VRRLGASGRPLLGAHFAGVATRFAVFTTASRCAVVLVDAAERELQRVWLAPLGDGYYEASVEGVAPGALYWFEVDGKKLPDPYARSLPRGVHGPACVVGAGRARRHALPQRRRSEHVIYELHVGTFSEEGTFAAAQRRLPALVELGVTTLELMPVAAFAGERGWGYDGVSLYAPHPAYGTLDELCELVDEAHGLGLSVLLDVVYNHFGPAGNYLSAYAESYFSEEHSNAWGKAPSFAHAPLRDLVLENARFWLEEIGFDGLRLDATHAIVDLSAKHVLRELAEQARALSPPRLLFAEDERNLAELVTDVGLSGVWADDFHHQLHVTMTGEREGYYADFEPSAGRLADVINRGWAFSGQVSQVSGKARGSSADGLPAEALVYCIQNHDQVGNRALGERLSRQLSPEAFRAASLLLLFLPMTPLLFMGQEWGAGSPFLYFTDHEPELGELVSQGRRREFAAFAAFADEGAERAIPDPQARSTFEASKLRFRERELPEAALTLELYRAALSLRRTDPVLVRSGRAELSAQVTREVLFVHRSHGSERRVLAMNFGAEPLPLSECAALSGLGRARALLASSERAKTCLLRHDAVVLAG
jgi:maltooligosyltrehalose trehalohydrolase